MTASIEGKADQELIFEDYKLSLPQTNFFFTGNIRKPVPVTDVPVWKILFHCFILPTALKRKKPNEFPKPQNEVPEPFASKQLSISAYK